jgi:hypothetical protein
MKAYRFASLVVLSTAALMAQNPAPAPTFLTPTPAPVAQAHTSDVGFSYSIPSDWEVIDTQPMLPVVQQKLKNDSTSKDEARGAECVQFALLARHGSPLSVIEVVTLPFECFGQKFTDKELPGFAIGVAGGLKKSFTIEDPVYGAYMLGTHSLWIERATGASISNPEVKRTLETVCSILTKGAVCWISLAADDAALQTFEQGAVTLEGDSAPALVPGDVLKKEAVKVTPVKSVSP